MNCCTPIAVQLSLCMYSAEVFRWNSGTVLANELLCTYRCTAYCVCTVLVCFSRILAKYLLMNCCTPIAVQLSLCMYSAEVFRWNSGTVPANELLYTNFTIFSVRV
jgi:ABC-type arginine/histidine transport system permease subunit